jgi:hypothetical protein
MRLISGAKALVLAAFCYRFKRLRKAELSQMLQGRHSPPLPSRPESRVKKTKPRHSSRPSNRSGHHKPPTSSSSRTICQQARQCGPNLVQRHRPSPEQVKGTCTLEELGVNSLVATKVLSYIRTNLDLETAFTNFLSFSNMNTLVTT